MLVISSNDALVERRVLLQQNDDALAQSLRECCLAQKPGGIARGYQAYEYVLRANSFGHFLRDALGLIAFTLANVKSKSAEKGAQFRTCIFANSIKPVC